MGYFLGNVIDIAEYRKNEKVFSDFLFDWYNYLFVKIFSIALFHLNLYNWSHSKYGETFKFQLFGGTVVVTTNRDAIKVNDKIYYPKWLLTKSFSISNYKAYFNYEKFPKTKTNGRSDRFPIKYKVIEILFKFKSNFVYEI